ncbi:hypothetical protein HK405_006507 [Cladochytrium tenue]|nr:hypothetical protein HK405_006507 [Cladochytrium tenue]
MIGIWLAALWQSSGRPSGVQLVELGPGRGTLLADVLATVQQLDGLRDAVASIHLVEASPALKRVQARTLGFELDDEEGAVPDVLDGRKAPFFWHDALELVPETGPTYIICHEFFDALPVHQFEKMADGWHEILVDIDESPSSPYHFRFLRSAEPAPSALTLLGHPRFAALPVGFCAEVCPEARLVAATIGKRIAARGGAALFVDYGKDTVPSHTFRSAFLERMGIRARLDRLLAACNRPRASGAADPAAAAAAARALRQGYERLVGPSAAGGMGAVYRCLAAAPAGAAPPYPFGESGAAK